MEFDWPRILKGQGTPATEPRPPVEARRQRPDNRRPPPSPPAPSRPVQPSAPAVPRRPNTEESQIAESSLPAPASEPASEIMDANRSRQWSPDVAPPPENDTPTPAHAKIGAEGVQRLRARYAEILARIPERTVDPQRQEELKRLADRLNPDSWGTRGRRRPRARAGPNRCSPRFGKWSARSGAGGDEDGGRGQLSRGETQGRTRLWLRGRAVTRFDRRTRGRR